MPDVLPGQTARYKCECGSLLQAQKYGIERQIAAELLALKLQTLDSGIAEANTLLSEKQTALEAVIAEQRSLQGHFSVKNDDRRKVIFQVGLDRIRQQK